jgi:hypothetical protein
MKKLVFSILGVVLALQVGGPALANGNGSATDMQVFYDCEQHTVNFKQVSLDSSHSQINFIYEFPQLDKFLPVIDQITGGENTNPPPHNGFNPLWLKVYVMFNDPNNLPLNTLQEQINLSLCTDGCISPIDPSCPATPPFTLVSSGMVFRCSVVGQKSPKGP